ncbi:zinc metalloproteinase nas-4-like [Culicoides brevitarsis]|uniref:zinc metalloproteinase nas-4-like n=1 Tax=Culicoides brevitarsis TaxID=469753 RepID=UPI00307BCE7A
MRFGIYWVVHVTMDSKFLIFLTFLTLGNAFPTTKLKAGYQELDEWSRFKLKHLTKNDNIEVYSGQFEGDIVLTQEQLESLMGKNGIIKETKRWINHTVPYVIKENNFNFEQINYIHKALRQLELVTCLKFVQWTGQQDYLEVAGDIAGCWTYVGRIGNKQTLHLEPSALEVNCFRLATIQHEFMHALGFEHMQSSFDRDDYVEIKWENLWPGTEHNFEKYNSSVVTGFGVPYDYNSVMHYGPLDFSINGLQTIVPRDPNANIGQRTGLSRRDIEKINRMYECPL